jgi:hypothetical protein
MTNDSMTALIANVKENIDGNRRESERGFGSYLYYGEAIRSTSLPHHSEGDGVCRISIDSRMWMPRRDMWGVRDGLPFSGEL